MAYVLRSLKAALPSVMMASSLAILHHGKRRVNGPSNWAAKKGFLAFNQGIFLIKPNAQKDAWIDTDIHDVVGRTAMAAIGAPLRHVSQIVPTMRWLAEMMIMSLV